MKFAKAALVVLAVKVWVVASGSLDSQMGVASGEEAPDARGIPLLMGNDSAWKDVGGKEDSEREKAATTATEEVGTIDFEALKLDFAQAQAEITKEILDVEGKKPKSAQLRTQIKFLEGATAVLGDAAQEAAAQEPTGWEVIDSAYQTMATSLNNFVELVPKALGMMQTTLEVAEMEEVNARLKASAKGSNSARELQAEALDDSDIPKGSYQNKNQNRDGKVPHKSSSTGSSSQNTHGNFHHAKHRSRFQSIVDSHPQRKHHFEQVGKLHDAILSGDHGTLFGHLQSAHARSIRTTQPSGLRHLQQETPIELKAKQCRQLIKCISQMSLYDLVIYFHSDDIDHTNGEIDSNIFRHVSAPNILEVYNNYRVANRRRPEDREEIANGELPYDWDWYLTQSAPGARCDQTLELFHRSIEFGDIPQWEGATVSQVCQAQGSQTYLQFGDVAQKVSTQAAEEMAKEMFQCSKDLYNSDANPKAAPFPFTRNDLIRVDTGHVDSIVQQGGDSHTGNQLIPLFDNRVDTYYESPRNDVKTNIHAHFHSGGPFTITSIEFNWMVDLDDTNGKRSCPSDDIKIKDASGTSVDFRWGPWRLMHTEDTLQFDPYYKSRTAYFDTGSGDFNTNKVQITCESGQRLWMHNIKFYGEPQTSLYGSGVVDMDLGSVDGLGAYIYQEDDPHRDFSSGVDGDLSTFWVSSGTVLLDVPLRLWGYKLRGNNVYDHSVDGENQFQSIVKELEIDWDYYGRCYSGFSVEVKSYDGSSYEWITIHNGKAPVNRATEAGVDLQKDVYKFHSNTVAGRNIRIRCTGSRDGAKIWKIREVRVRGIPIHGDFIGDYQTDFYLPSGIRSGGSNQDNYGQLEGPYTSPYSYGSFRVIEDLEDVRVTMARAYFMIRCNWLKDIAYWTPLRAELASRYPDPDPGVGKTTSLNDIHFNDISSFEQADYYLQMVREAEGNDEYEEMVICTLDKVDDLGGCIDGDGKVKDEAKDAYKAFNDQIKDKYDQIQSGFNLIFGKQASLGYVCGVAEAVDTHGPERWPGTCCLDAPYQNDGDHWGRKYDCSEPCKRHAPFFNGISEGSCDTVGGTWCPTPTNCQVLKDCLDEEYETANSTGAIAYRNYLKPGLVGDPTDPESCGDSRQYFGFDALYTNDEDVCDNVKQLHNTKNFGFLEEFFSIGGEDRAWDSFDTSMQDIDTSAWSLLTPPDHSKSESKLIAEHGKNWPQAVFGMRQILNPFVLALDVVDGIECVMGPVMVDGGASNTICVAWKNTWLLPAFVVLHTALWAIDIMEFTSTAATTVSNVEPFQDNEVLKVQHKNNHLAYKNLRKTFDGVSIVNQNVQTVSDRLEALEDYLGTVDGDEKKIDQMDTKLDEIQCMLDASTCPAAERKLEEESSNSLEGGKDVPNMNTGLVELNAEMKALKGELSQVKKEMKSQLNKMEAQLAALISHLQMDGKEE